MKHPFAPRLLQQVSGARRIVALTGAGVSAESGVPTFRDAQTGPWSRFRPEELATPEAFRRDPQLIWDWYEGRRGLVARAVPNAAHRALARLETLAADFTLITQNVDRLHQRAGSRAVIELHGNILGTSAVVYPAARLALNALQSGAAVIEINKDPTPLSAAATFSLRGLAGTVLPALLEAAWPK